MTDRIKPRVMLVEDEDLLRRVLRMGLEKMCGCEVVDFAHGLLAYEDLVRHDANGEKGFYNLILSDINMPYMDGIEFLTRAQRLIDTEKTNVVAMSGLASEHSLRIPSYVKEVLQKPFSMDQLKRLQHSYARTIKPQELSTF